MKSFGRRAVSALISGTLLFAMPGCDDGAQQCEAAEDGGLGGKADNGDDADAEQTPTDPMQHIYYEVTPRDGGGMSFVFVDSMRGIELSGNVDMFDAGNTRASGETFRLHLEENSTYTGDLEMRLVPQLVQLEGTDEAEEMLVPTVVTNTIGDFNESDPVLAAMMADLMAKMDEDARIMEIEANPENAFRAKRHKLKQCIGLVGGGVGIYLIKGFFLAPPAAIIAALGLGAVCAGVMIGEVDLCGDRKASISVDIGADVICG